MMIYLALINYAYYVSVIASGPLNLNRTSSMHFMRHYEPISMGE